MLVQIQSWAPIENTQLHAECFLLVSGFERAEDFVRAEPTSTYYFGEQSELK